MASSTSSKRYASKIDLPEEVTKMFHEIADKMNGPIAVVWYTGNEFEVWILSEEEDQEIGLSYILENNTASDEYIEIKQNNNSGMPDTCLIAKKNIPIDKPIAFQEGVVTTEEKICRIHPNTLRHTQDRTVFIDRNLVLNLARHVGIDYRSCPDLCLDSTRTPSETYFFDLPDPVHVNGNCERFFVFRKDTASVHIVFYTLRLVEKDERLFVDDSYY